MPRKQYHIIGLMSGTSLDGLDVAHCIFTFENGVWKYEISAAECYEYSTQLADQLHNAPNLSGKELMLLHKNFGFYLAEKVNAFIAEKKLQPQLICSHGHTIYHTPEKYLSQQIGDGAALFAATGIPVVCDFRSVDVCAGGQGAPLVPIGDKLLFAEYEFCLNLGGIANISFDDDTGKRVAFDISPCNLVLNKLAETTGKKYDAGGEMARSGKVEKLLLAELNNWNYYAQTPPKSLDKDALLAKLLPILNKYNLPAEDKLATAAEHISEQICQSVNSAFAYMHASKNGLNKPGKLLVTGGGAFNNFLIELLQQKLENVRVIIPSENIIQYKEALIFAFLGLLRVLGRPNSLASITGAKKDTIGGALYGCFDV